MNHDLEVEFRRVRFVMQRLRLLSTRASILSNDAVMEKLGEFELRFEYYEDCMDAIINKINEILEAR